MVCRGGNSVLRCNACREEVQHPLHLPDAGARALAARHRHRRRRRRRRRRALRVTGGGSPVDPLQAYHAADGQVLVPVARPARCPPRRGGPGGGGMTALARRWRSWWPDTRVAAARAVARPRWSSTTTRGLVWFLFLSSFPERCDMHGGLRRTGLRIQLLDLHLLAR
jgi:hypothetical protein